MYISRQVFRLRSRRSLVLRCGGLGFRDLKRNCHGKRQVLTPPCPKLTLQPVRFSDKPCFKDSARFFESPNLVHDHKNPVSFFGKLEDIDEKRARKQRLKADFVQLLVFFGM